MELKNKDGSLSAYGLSCGYIEKTTIGGIEIKLSHEHSHYHVRAYDFKNHERLQWDIYEKISNARKAYKKVVKRITLEHKG